VASKSVGGSCRQHWASARRVGPVRSRLLRQRRGVADGDFAAPPWNDGEAVTILAEGDLTTEGAETEQELAGLCVPNPASAGQAFAIGAEKAALRLGSALTLNP
jgi:hypothetical protein